MLTQYILLFSFLSLSLSEKVYHDGHKVLQVIPETIEHLKILQQLESEFDFWTSPRAVGRPVDIRVSPQQASRLNVRLLKDGLKYETKIEDIGRLIRQQEVERSQKTPSQYFQYDVYHTLAEIDAWTDEIAANYSDIVTLVVLENRSFEGRPLKVLKVSTGGMEKPAFWFDGGIHAREWISPATVMYMANQLLTGYINGDPEIVSLLTEMDWYIMPVFNVDGYEYTWTNDRLWRKTRSTNAGSVCIGTDPNRNWDVEWGTVGVSHNPCMDTYCGSAPFSEIEVDTVQLYISTITTLVAYYAYHSYGQFYMAPVGFDPVPTPDYEEHMRVCQAGEAAIEAVNGLDYICDSLYNTVGLSSGSSADFTYANLNIMYSFGVELRDKGAFGFLLPEDQIIPCAMENFEGLKVMAREILNGPVRQM